MVCQLIFWLVPSFAVSATAIALQGFSLGPLFPAAVVTATRILPVHLHVSAIGFAAAFGGSGAAVLPFGVGALAQARGVTILQPVVLAILAFCFLLWLCLPRITKALPGSSPEAPIKSRQWINIDFDLVDTGKRVFKGAKGCTAQNDER